VKYLITRSYVCQLDVISLVTCCVIARIFFLRIRADCRIIAKVEKDLNFFNVVLLKKHNIFGVKILECGFTSHAGSYPVLGPSVNKHRQ